MSNRNWSGIPDELSTEQKEFMKKHALAFSSGYVGMLRLYRDDPSNKKCRYSQTVWQSSSGGHVVSLVISKMDLPTMEELQDQGLKYINHLMSLPDDQLQKELDKDTPLL